MHNWVLPALAVALLVIGTVTVTIAIMIGLTDSSDDNESKQVPALASTPSSVPSLSGDETSPGDTADGPIAELADPGWVSRTASATGIPARALAAYAGASLSANRTHTGCSIGWNTLAAIGGVESAHGSLNGAILNDDGTVGPEIIGVALDGDGVAKITDTDNGDLDGDTTWDRAVGPMQFLPSTWDAYAVDGNDDGSPTSTTSTTPHCPLPATCARPAVISLSRTTGSRPSRPTTPAPTTTPACPTSRRRTPAQPTPADTARLFSSVQPARVVDIGTRRGDAIRDVD